MEFPASKPEELVCRLQRHVAAVEAKYAEYKRREDAHRARAARAPNAVTAELELRAAALEQAKAHGIGVAIVSLRLNMAVPLDVDIPLPDTKAGDLPEV